MGRSSGRQWGESTAAYGENCMAAVTCRSRRLAHLWRNRQPVVLVHRAAQHLQALVHLSFDSC